MVSKICVVGGAGFIGSHIVEALLEDNNIVTVIDDLSAGKRENLPKSITFIQRSVSALGDYFKDEKFDWVINLAAQVSTFESITSPEKDFRTNAEGMFYLLEALRKANYDGKFIYTSSRSIYGDIKNEDWVVTENNTNYKPSSVYNTNKYYGELLTRLYGQLYGLKYWIVRPSNVYGPRQPATGLYNFICRWVAYAMQDKAIPIWGDGKQVRDFVYVGDIADGYRKIIQRGSLAQDTFLFASGEATTLEYLAKLIFHEIDKPLKIEYKPAKAGDIRRFVGDSSAAKYHLNWEPKVELKSGMKNTINWVKDNINLYEEYNL